MPARNNLATSMTPYADWSTTVPVAALSGDCKRGRLRSSQTQSCGRSHQPGRRLMADSIADLERLNHRGHREDQSKNFINSKLPLCPLWLRFKQTRNQIALERSMDRC